MSITLTVITKHGIGLYAMNSCFDMLLKLLQTHETFFIFTPTLIWMSIFECPFSFQCWNPLKSQNFDYLTDTRNEVVFSATVFLRRTIRFYSNSSDTWLLLCGIFWDDITVFLMVTFPVFNVDHAY
jgi:hypothetical protein